MKLRSLKKVTKVAAPVERTVQWSVEVTEENFDFLKESTENNELEIGEMVDLSGQVFIKRLSFEDIEATSKAYQWDFDFENLENSKMIGLNHRLLRAAQLLGSVCEDEKGTKFFESVDDVFDSDPIFVEALYQVADSVNKFSGKSLKKNSTNSNSGVNSQSAESVETESKTASET
ncbi:phage tail assembly chaperone family protein, TAC [Acinetobacter nosocomialis]|uniref:phage tail assembly chaperone family protein, TAC n=1 Tax=Acinetobacter nosocomialis TaxID=106654 RepID=UPI001B83B674|nr:phage tail assembly chaperone family protein, TAC [Acinetobacter nosocomialis]MBR7685914.1 phage tail assembly chaperone family protein, TAC [Acinetobacter nosocomialis]MBR7700287.1 phage tail assembly chaperone family protein, TAC [Acinetobacter nosocomialis]MBR7759135.1 phage tail assembly chaperone family protein, TAC [Acinetobacter nosocomialis]MCE5995650.1 phage tail assembly chaperone family protein, TAC [Acinetobacter nosocomialis]